MIWLRAAGKLLGKIPLRWWLYIAAAAAIAGVIWHDHYITKKRNAEIVEHRHHVEKLEKELDQADERAAIAIENARLAREASDEYQQTLEKLKRDRADTPVRTVRLCFADSDVPAAAGGHGAPWPEGLPEAPRSDPRVSRDIGPDVYELADEADQCAAQRDALIDWVTRRCKAQ